MSDPPEPLEPDYTVGTTPDSDFSPSPDTKLRGENDRQKGPTRHLTWHNVPVFFLISYVLVLIEYVYPGTFGVLVLIPMIPLFLACFPAYYIASKRDGRPWLRYAFGHLVLAPLTAGLWFVFRTGSEAQ